VRPEVLAFDEEIDTRAATTRMRRKMVGCMETSFRRWGHSL